ncbi:MULTISPECIES: hypothetical protein [unclassified Bacillus (in: firmicutes)]|uniref:hypothetical protein n=1 Tax=unclassified Bacillus (in: firmicutes) TaxID=185979 RepID=UPI001BEC4DFA|nr:MULTISPECIES: hypothetical protein [unclassified Bacillus (in: firmicutes)]MBT2638478.1 hypothetical protein [Bacillus sp. ISL-39]MBT2662156.1 hypothetical protein [Bacillus sp. ISL-45]
MDGILTDFIFFCFLKESGVIARIRCIGFLVAASSSDRFEWETRKSCQENNGIVTDLVNTGKAVKIPVELNQEWPE